MAKEYKCLRRVRHNGKTYPANALIELEDADANPLIAREAIRSMDDEDGGDPSAGGSDGQSNQPPSDVPTVEQRAQIITAIGGLTEGDFISAGSPKTSALTKAAGLDVSGSERDRAWDIVEAVRALPEVNLDLALVISKSGIADVSEAEFTAALALRPKGEAS